MFISKTAPTTVVFRGNFPYPTHAQRESRKVPLITSAVFRYASFSWSRGHFFVRAARAGDLMCVRARCTRTHHCISLGPQGPKLKIFKKRKKHPQVFTQGTSVPNFSRIEPFLGSLGCPKVLGHTYRQTDRQTDRQTLSDSSSTENEIMKIY